MSTRAAPGPQLSAGRLRVDAARAIAKLREYQLVDRTAWVLEAIRAGVASGATKLRLSGDANDVWLAWEGTPWPADDLPRLFDELVSPEPTEERHHLRLLAAAVNSALGIDPAYVDIYSVSPEATLRARYTPNVLIETAALEDSPLREIKAEPASAPADIAPASGMLVHVRRRTALGMLTYLFWEREPPELATARAACRDLAVPLVIGSVTYCRTDLGHDLERIPLGGDLDGYVALRDPAAPRPGYHDATLEIAERGVLLATYPLAIAPTEAAKSLANELRAPLPIRVFVDAKRMPTNASRSQVRQEVPPISTAMQRGPAVAAELIKKLASEVAEPGCDERKRAAALSLVAAVIAGPDWSTMNMSLQLGKFGKLPLLRDAAGVPRPVGHPWSGHVYTGKEPLSGELGPWVSSILWIPRGDPAAGIIAGAFVDSRDTKRRIGWAKDQRKAHAKFFRHPPAPVALASKTAPRVRITLGAKRAGSPVPDSRFVNLTGELGLTFDRADGDVLLMYQGRPIERLTVPSPIGFEAVVDSPQLTPGDDYRSVARDVYFRCVEMGLEAAVICAAEVIALDLADTPSEMQNGITVGPRGSYDNEARVVRAALVMARKLQLQRSPLLAAAPAWRTLDGRWIDFRAVATHSVIGVASGTHRFTPPQGRLVLVGSGSQLDVLRPALRIVDYDKGRIVDDTRSERPDRLAAVLAATHGFALAIDNGEIAGAIAPATKSSIQLHHVGRALDTREYSGRLGKCALAVDSDAIIPDVDWKAAGDTAGLHSSDYRDWEVLLVRAALRALIGDRPLELHGPEVKLSGALASWAFAALAAEPTILDPFLDANLISDLRSAPIIHALGERDLVSIDTMVARFPQQLFYVVSALAPTEGFAPMVCDTATAVAIGKLTDLPVADAKDELENRRRAAKRNGRLTVHRAQAERAFTYPFDGIHVEIAPGSTSLSMRGLVGIGRSRLEIDVRIENRTFQTLTKTGGLPLYAVVDLHLAHADDQFQGLSDLVAAQLIEVVGRAAGPLLVEIAKRAPSQLGDLGPPRSLLRAWLEAERGNVAPTVREALCNAAAFLSVQGGRTSIAEAALPNNIVRTAIWQTEWLAPLVDEPQTALDANVIKVGHLEGELNDVVRRLHTGYLADATGEVTKLQAQRRMARGLIPVPTLPHVPSELKRKLRELGPIGMKLGHGEIGLVAGTSSALIHDHGVLRQRFTLDVAPAIHLAIEAPELLDEVEAAPGLDLGGDVADQLARLRDLGGRAAKSGPALLGKDAQQLALQLLAAIFATPSRDSLPIEIKQSIRLALVTRRLAADAVKIPVFELTDGSWVDISVLDQQIDKFGSAWAVTSPTRQVPLDDDRVVFVFAPAELTSAYGSYAVIDATSELALDDKARRNRAKPLATSLDLRGRDYILAESELAGDGVTKPRGVVGALLPHAVEQRGLYAHKAMLPLEVMNDPCRWPSIAVVDDDRLTPDRAWERPSTTTAVWGELTARVGAASERAITLAMQRPQNAFAHLHVGVASPLGAHAMSSKLQARGAVWLLGAPRPPHIQIEVIDAYGRHLYTPEHALGMAGKIYVHAPQGWDRQAVLDEALPKLYGLMMKQLIGRKNVPADLIAAHLATALALEVIAPSDLDEMPFSCFRPTPLGPMALARMFEGKEQIQVLPVAELEAELFDPDAEGVVEDGSELSQAIIARLGARAFRGRVEKKKRKKQAEVPVEVAPLIPEPPRPAIVVDTPEPKPMPAPKPPPPKPRITVEPIAHAIQNVADAVRLRLVDVNVPAFEVTVEDTASPLLAFSRGKLRFAGQDSRLHAIANALRANSPWAPLAVDAVIAHAITVLDEARSEVNPQTVRDVLATLLAD